MTEVVGRVAGVVRRPRLAYIDQARGLAVLLMIGDHVARLVPAGEAFRVTAGRVAMPLFFVLAGTLARRLSARTLGVGLLGVALPLVVPWLDLPNVLTWWALGCVVLYLTRDLPAVRVVLLVVALGLYANRWALLPGIDSYEPLGLLGLMLAGAQLRASSWAWAGRLPAWFAVVGRYPVSVYVGQALVLQTVILLGGLS